MITQESIEEVKERSSLIELVGESGALKRQGSNYVGLCPFHQEKTGSFHIRDGGKFYHCFGCGASGNPISYYMHTRGVSFPQAVEELAERFGVTLQFTEKRELNKPREDTNQYFEINRLATDFYSKALQTAPEVVKNYIVKRQLRPETLEKFAVGFSQPSWNSLSDYLKSKKVPEESILTSGLARRSQKGDLYDVFRARLIFPIFSDNKKIAAFGGRLIPDLIDKESAAQAPKYLNSPDNPVYHKNKVLYGVPQAITAIREQGFVYIVEGYMDVISLWQAGVQNVVATCGTALTPGHIKRLAFLCKRAFILFDGDNAGRTAASKAFALFLNSGVDAKVLFLPEAEDPDSIACRMKEKTAEYLASVETHSLLSCYMDSIFARYSVKSVKDLGAALKGQVAEEISVLLNSVKNPVERAELIGQAAFKLKVDESILDNLAASKTPKVEVETEPEQDTEVIEEVPLKKKAISELPALDQEILLVVMAKREEMIEKVVNHPDLCPNLQPKTRAFIEEFSQVLSDNAGNNAEKKESIKTLLKEYGDSWLHHWKKAHEMNEDARVDFAVSYTQCLKRVKKDKLKQTVRALEDTLQQTAEDDAKTKLYQELMNLQKQINAI